ncbi:MAG: ABC transporter permease subunit, partial [Saprospiraceae bacterium]
HDVATGMIAGARVALLTGLVAMGIAFLIGALLGALAGFWGDDRLWIRSGRLWATLLGVPVAWFYAFIAGPAGLPGVTMWIKNLLVFFTIILIFNFLGKLISRLPVLSRSVIIPADLLVMRFGEIVNALPKFIFLLIVARLFGGNQPLLLMIALIGAFSWPGVASLVRGELLRVRTLDFVTAARGLGLSELQVLLRHALPNALRAAYIAAALGVAGAIQLEAGLSFLGLSGPGMEGASWGMLLHAAREARTAWWLALLPGLAICITVLALNRVGEVWSERKS